MPAVVTRRHAAVEMAAEVAVKGIAIDIDKVGLVLRASRCGALRRARLTLSKLRAR